MTTVKNVYIVFGWRVSDAIRNSMMMEKGEEARNMGITLTMSGDGKNSFVGEHIGTLDLKDGQDYTGIPMPGDDQGSPLKEKMRTLSWEMGPPLIYVVAG